MLFVGDTFLLESRFSENLVSHCILENFRCLLQDRVKEVKEDFPAFLGTTAESN